MFTLAATSGVLIWVVCILSRDEIPLIEQVEAHATPQLRSPSDTLDSGQPGSDSATHAEDSTEHAWTPQRLGISIRSTQEAEVHLTIDDEATWRNLSYALNPAHPLPLPPDGGLQQEGGHLGGLAVLELFNTSLRLSQLVDVLKAHNASHQLALTLEQVVRPRVNSSAALLREGVEQLRRKGVELKLQGRTHLRKKRAELAFVSAQVHNSSLALADAIASGEVQRSVILFVVAAFLTIALVIQALSSARGRLRQFVRHCAARVLLRSPAPNELVTRPYAGWTELGLRVSLDFLNEPANIMLLSIGSLQVLATWSKADPWRCKKINLLVLLLNFAYTLVQEVLAQRLAGKHDGAWNLTPCVRVGGQAAAAAADESSVLAKDLEVGSVIRLRQGEVCPAVGKLEFASHSYVLFNSLCETGEDCCTILTVGDTVPLGFILALEEAEVHVRITETRNGATETPGGAQAIAASPLKSRRMERFPEHMNQALTQANLGALALLFGAAALVAALNYHGASGRFLKPGQTELHGAGLSQAEVSLVTHFFSAVVQLNTLIPSMRWVVLFFFYVFLLEAARPEVRVQNWRALRGLESCRVLFSDKTGTLTEVGLSVAHLRLAEGGGATLSSGDADVAWLALVLLACNDSQPRPRGSLQGPLAGRRPGTSPEEIAIAEHLEDRLGLGIASSPLQPGVAPEGPPGAAAAVHSWPLVLQEAASGREAARASVLARSDFDPALGYREARISIEAGAWVVRQGGSDLMADLAGCGSREVALAAEDCDRALGWCVARLGADGQRVGAWRYVLRASFANPPRATSAPLVAHCRSAGIAVRVLTGDACVAAVHIAREIGVVPGPPVAPGGEDPSRVCIYRPGETASAFSLRVRASLAASPEGLCVVLPGKLLREQIEARGGADAWLAEERVSAVIYRTRSADKAFIVRRAEELGRARYDAQASGFSMWKKCMPRRQAEDSFCMMMGDAANDADAISLEGVVGVSLSHGAAPCKLGADFLVTVPGALVAVLTELQGRSLAGARWLLEDVCMLCGFVSALTLCGVWAAGFQFLPRGFLYDDPFDARLMTLFSSGLYAPSACAAACHVGSRAAVAGAPAGDLPGVLRALLLGAVAGCAAGLAGPSEDHGRFGRWILSAVSTASLVRHSSVLLRCRRQRAAAAGAKEEAAGVGPSNRLARLLGETAVGRARAALLLFYLLLVWTA